MNKDKIHLTDIKRILLGEAPGAFMLEVFFRSIISYIVLLAIVKMLGKRMSGRLTPTEMAVMLMFGAIVSSSMQIPDRGIIEGSFVLLLVVFLQRLTTLLTTRSQRAEDMILGQMLLLIKDGVLQTTELAAEKISRNQLFAMLRSKKVVQLGEIKRLYMETKGAFSIYKADKAPPGLSVLPEDDALLYAAQQTDANSRVCYHCGKLYSNEKLPGKCELCKGTRFIEPVIKKA